MEKVVFLDRDGVLNADVNYPHKIEDFSLLPGVIEGLRLIADLGYKLLIITNQSGIGRGYFKEEDFWRFQNHLIENLAEGGVLIDGIYFCPHHPEDGCDCRKPKTGLIDRARLDFSFDPAAGFLIGDSWTDVKCGHDAGLKTIYLENITDVATPKPYLFEKEPHFKAKDLPEAALIIKGL